MAIRRYDFTATFNDKDEWDINPPFINTASSVYIRQIRGSRVKIAIESGEQIFSFDSENGLGFVIPAFSKLRLEYRDRTANKVEELSLYVSDVPGGIQDNRLVVNEGTAPVPVDILNQPVEVYFDTSNALPVDIQNQPVEVSGILGSPVQVQGPDGNPLQVQGAVTAVGNVSASPGFDLNVRVRNAPTGALETDIFFQSQTILIPVSTPVRVLFYLPPYGTTTHFIRSVVMYFVPLWQVTVQQSNGELSVETAIGNTDDEGSIRRYTLRAKDTLIIEDENIVEAELRWRTVEQIPSTSSIRMVVNTQFGSRQ